MHWISVLLNSLTRDCRDVKTRSHWGLPLCTYAFVSSSGFSLILSTFPRHKEKYQLWLDICARLKYIRKSLVWTRLNHQMNSSIFSHKIENRIEIKIARTDSKNETTQLKLNCVQLDFRWKSSRRID